MTDKDFDISISGSIDTVREKIAMHGLRIQLIVDDPERKGEACIHIRGTEEQFNSFIDTEWSTRWGREVIFKVRG